MNLPALARRLGACAALTGVAAFTAGAGTAPADVSSAGAAPKIGPAGVGAVKIGKKYTALRKRKLVGKIRRGCELGGPNTRSAPLRRPLSGTVDFSQTSSRKVTNIVVRGGAKTARGIGRGSTLEQIRAAYPRAKVDRATEEVFGWTLVTIPKSDGGRFQFAVSTDTGKTIATGIPRIAVCE